MRNGDRSGRKRLKGLLKTARSADEQRGGDVIANDREQSSDGRPVEWDDQALKERQAAYWRRHKDEIGKGRSLDEVFTKHETSQPE